MAGEAYGWLRPVRRSLDVVAMDQRGTGGSHPLNCGANAAARPAAAFGHVFDPEVVARCRAELERSADLAQYTTDASVQDVDELRAQLGYERISLYGVSYGTRLAQAYLRRHPDRVSACVLDGVVPFDRVVPLTYARSAQQSLDRVFAACAADAACRRSHPGPADDMTAILTRLAAGPAQTTVRAPGGAAVPVTMTSGDFGYAVRGILYAGGDATRDLTDLLGRAAANGDLSGFAQRYLDRAIGLESDVADGMHFSVFCAEDIPFASEQDIARETAGTFLGRYLFDEYRRACAAWPRGQIPADARTPVASRVPTLLVSGFFDPVTPPEFAQSVAASLPLARLLVSPTGGHGSALECPREAVLHLLTTGTFDRMPVACR
jgi:pimeloyl-ACP methyl ester carboxylesterase